MTRHQHKLNVVELRLAGSNEEDIGKVTLKLIDISPRENLK